MPGPGRYGVRRRRELAGRAPHRSPAGKLQAARTRSRAAVRRAPAPLVGLGGEGMPGSEAIMGAVLTATDRARAQRRYERMWPEIAKALGKPANSKPPKLDRERLPGLSQSIRGFHKRGEREINLSPYVLAALGGRKLPGDPGRGARQEAKKTVIHELAHVFQRPARRHPREVQLAEGKKVVSRRRPRYAIEGGAELFAQELSKRMGMDPGPISYPDYVHVLGDTRPPSFWRRRQFR